MFLHSLPTVYTLTHFSMEKHGYSFKTSHTGFSRTIIFLCDKVRTIFSALTVPFGVD